MYVLAMGRRETTEVPEGKFVNVDLAIRINR